MAKKSVIERQKKREILVKRNWDKRQELKKAALDPSLPEEQREAARTKLNQMPRNTAAIRLRSRCQFTGRPRAVLRKFQLSRLCFREMALQGLIPGITKASW